MIAITNQAELDAAIAKGTTEVECNCDAVLRVTANVVIRCGSSQPRVEAYGSSQPRVVAYGSSQPRVEAYDSSQPRVEAYDSSQPRVEAYAYAMLACFGACALLLHNGKGCALIDAKVRVSGSGMTIQIAAAQTTQDWCAHYGLTWLDGVVDLYKCVDDAFGTRNGVRYTPGTIPEAPDWDGGKNECGGGLHFAPTPAIARKFKKDGARFVRCPVRLSDIVVHPNAEYPDKVKAPRCCGPVVECDEFGEPLAKTITEDTPHGEETEPVPVEKG